MAPPKLLQSKGDSFANSTSGRSITLATSVTAGSLLIVSCNSFGTSITLTVADDLSNSFTQAGSYAITGSDRASNWYLYNATSGSRTITVTPSATAFIGMCVREFSGMPSSGSPTSTNTSNATAATVGTGSLTITQNAVVVLAASITAAKQLHGATGIACDYFDNNGSFEPLAAGWAIADATYTPSLLLGASATWACAVAAFNAASSGAGGATRQRGLRSGGKL